VSPKRDRPLSDDIGMVPKILPEQADAAARFAREIAERDGWDCGDVLSMLGQEAS
jgi:hypothetical protein